MPDWVLPGTIYFRLENDTLGARFFWWPDRHTWRVQYRGGEILELGRPLVPPIEGAWDEGIDFDAHFHRETIDQIGLPAVDRLQTTTGADGIPAAVVERPPYRWNVVRRYDPPHSGYPQNLVVYRWGKRGENGRGYLTDVLYAAEFHLHSG
jgi:hypothetical protein